MILYRIRKASRDTVRTTLKWLIDIKPELLYELASAEVHVVLYFFVVLLRDGLELSLQVFAQTAWYKSVHEFLCRFGTTSDPTISTSGE